MHEGHGPLSHPVDFSHVARGIRDRLHDLVDDAFRACSYLQLDVTGLHGRELDGVACFINPLLGGGVPAGEKTLRAACHGTGEGYLIVDPHINILIG